MTVLVKVRGDFAQVGLRGFAVVQSVCIDEVKGIVIRAVRSGRDCMTARCVGVFWLS